MEGRESPGKKWVPKRPPSGMRDGSTKAIFAAGVELELPKQQSASSKNSWDGETSKLQLTPVSEQQLGASNVGIPAWAVSLGAQHSIPQSVANAIAQEPMRLKARRVIIAM
jgi:hypothetical protein